MVIRWQIYGRIFLSVGAVGDVIQLKMRWLAGGVTSFDLFAHAWLLRWLLLGVALSVGLTYTVGWRVTLQIY